MLLTPILPGSWQSLATAGPECRPHHACGSECFQPTVTAELKASHCGMAEEVCAECMTIGWTFMFYSQVAFSLLPALLAPRSIS